MAALQERNGSFRVLFRYLGKQHTLTVGKVSKAEAEAFAGKVDYLLLRIRQKLIHLPTGVSITDFVLTDGQVRPAEPPAVTDSLPFAAFRKRYLDTVRDGMEANSLATLDMHLGHLQRTLGEAFPLRELQLSDLQRHVTNRARKKYRGKALSPVTLKKEVASFRAAWNWAALTGLVSGPFPSKGLVYPKGDEKPPFMTRAEIERKTAGLTEAEAEGYWEALYLRKEEVDDFLAYTKAAAGQPWLYPLTCTAALTGARRSELLRAEVTDVDLAADTILIREKKRSKKQRTTRHVSLTPVLKAVLTEWLEVHPGGRFLFCQSGVVAKSKNRSPTTGHRSGKKRPSSLKGRLTTVRGRDDQPVSPISRDETHDHFRRAVRGSKWDVLRGFHVLRHSFISCLAAAGVDQRIIDDFVGHQTDEQRKRYRHLIPDVKQKAIAGVFG